MLNRLQDVFASLNRHDVRYVVIGGIAAVLHGVPRATFDLDLLIDASPENADQGQSFFVIPKADLLASKRAAGRPVDLDDVRLLESGGT